jgi:hypothetical protein
VLRADGGFPPPSRIVTKRGANIAV